MVEKFRLNFKKIYIIFLWGWSLDIYSGQWDMIHARKIKIVPNKLAPHTSTSLGGSMDLVL